MIDPSSVAKAGFRAIATAAVLGIPALLWMYSRAAMDPHREDRGFLAYASSSEPIVGMIIFVVILFFCFIADQFYGDEKASPDKGAKKEST